MVKKRVWVIVGLLTALTVAPFSALWFRDTTAGQRWLERQIENFGHRALLKVSKDAIPSAFVTDGCSGGMSLIWPELSRQFPALKGELGDALPWKSCCISHDRVYHNAGASQTAKNSFEARVGADQALHQCVANLGVSMPKYTVEFDVLANAMYAAVRLGGAPCSSLSWRWGYGFPACHIGYQLLE